MEAVIDRRTVAGLQRHFAALSRHVPLRPIRNQRDYKAAVAALNALLDAGAADQRHPLADLVATLGELVGDYDDTHYPAKEVPPGDMLRFLLEQHRLTQSDVPEVGSQGVVSEVLSGKRALNLRQMRALSQRFAVPVAAFIDSGAGAK